MAPVAAGEIGADQTGEIASVAMGARIRSRELEPRGHGVGVTVIRVLAAFFELSDGGGVVAFRLQKLGELVVTGVRGGPRVGDGGGEEKDEKSEAPSLPTQRHRLTRSADSY